MRNICTVDACGRFVVGQGLCNLHYGRMRKHGSPTAITGRPRGTTEERFWPKVAMGDGCWLWLGSTKHGYGVLWDSDLRKVVRASHVSWRLHHGKPVPDGLLVCHRCDNPPCVRYDHLFLGTKQDNARDMVDKARNVTRRGEQHRSARLSEDDVRAIRQRYVPGVNPSHPGNSLALAKEFGVTRHHLSDIALGKTWRHVK